ncbi:MAG TPA: Gfo/Idh/MocA family oxidoreductase, partial [Thermomicrobiales bacterium]|nr:Gfo/Idh/MocA family oxidoreductase [Thermomicrobiales bacterium]
MQKSHDATTPLRAGVIGAGRWATEAHLPGLRSCAGVRIDAVADIDRGRAAAVAVRFGIPRVYESAPAMLDDAPLDLVVIATPDDAHADDATAALAGGLHVLCEKPLATTVVDAARLSRLAAEAGVVTRVGFAMRFAPAMRRMRDAIAAGAIGEPQWLQAFQQNGQFLDPATPFHWKMDRARTGGGAIVEYGIHTLDLARWLMGEVRSVSATARTWIPERPLPAGGRVPIDVDDSTGWLMEFERGGIGVCHAGWATAGRPPGLSFSVFGSEGALRCVLADDLPGAEGLWRAGRDGAFHSVPSAAVEAADESWWKRFPSLLIDDFIEEIR